MKVFRLAVRELAQNARQAFSGDGGLFAAGRWHRQGLRVVYAASSLPLAALERLAHLKRTFEVQDHVWYEMEIPDVRIERPAAYPTGWDAEPPGASSRDFGSKWLAGSSRPALVVPSVVVPGEFNVLLNPNHGDFSLGWVTGGPYRFRFDPRLLAARTSP